MKVCILSAAAATHVVRWANAIAQRGHEVTVVSCANSVPNESHKYLPEVKIKLLRFPSPIGYYLNAVEVRRIAAEEQFDVINIHYASGYGTLGRLAGLKDALLSVWGSDVYDFPYSNPINMWTIKSNLKYFKRLASTSHCMARQSQKLVDRAFDITPFGVDPALFCPMENMRDSNRFLFGTVKLLYPKYGITDTINAFTKLVLKLRQNGEAELASKLRYEIYGKGPQWDELQKLINDNGMSEQIRLCGFVHNSELPKIINSFDMFCCNSVMNSESFGVAAVEAMACGIPVVVSDADGFAEVVVHEQTGLIVPKGNVEAITEAMYRLLKDPELRAQYGKAGRARVMELYDWNKNVEGMLEIYQQMMA